jgi:hypothetical protein
LRLACEVLRLCARIESWLAGACLLACWAGAADILLSPPSSTLAWPGLPAVIAAWYGAALMSRFKWFTCPRTVSHKPRSRRSKLGHLDALQERRLVLAAQGFAVLPCNPCASPICSRQWRLLVPRLRYASIVNACCLLSCPSAPGPVHLAAHAVRRGARHLPPAHLPHGRPTGAGAAPVTLAICVCH